MSFIFSPFDIPPPVIVFIVVVIILIKTAKKNRRYTQETDQRLCRGCGTSHPTFATFCRRCGRKL